MLLISLQKNKIFICTMNSFFVINPRKSVLQIINATDLCVELSPDIVVYLSWFAKVFFLHQKQAAEYCFDKLVRRTFHLRTKVCKFTCACLVQMFCTASSQFVTVRNYCCGKVMFLQVSIHGGCLPLG